LGLALVVASCSEPTSAGQAALEKYLGKNFAGVKVQTLDGQAVAVGDYLKGRPVVLNVWATWCAPCTEELPSLDALGKEGKYAVVAIATDKDAASVKAYLKKNHLGAGMSVLWDSLGMVTASDLGARALPASYVLDPSGTVKLVAAGAREWVHPKMQAKIESALK
jgi:thiol-disulfide isomerase/thioredoxin